MFSDIIKNGIVNGKTNEEIVADIEKECKNHFSGSTVDFIVEDIEWYRTFIVSIPASRPFKTESF